jgi:2,3-bisphosphoglycerate-dependent phosphoglycerate mutase
MPYWCAGVLTLGLAAWSPVTGLRIPGKLGKRSWVGTRGFEQEGDKPTRKPGSNTVGQLVLLRHGVTAWDRTSTFTGWADPDIDDCGALEAKSAALALKESGFSFDIAYTSVLKRSIHTTWLLLKELGQVATPIYKSWRLNERSLGSLTGHTVEESIAEHGAEAVGSWRRSLDARPPPYEADHPFHPAADLKYYKWQDRSGEVSPIRPPGCESLRDAIRRALPVWYDEILPALCEGNNVLVVAHGNSLRAVLSAIEQLDDEQIAQLEIPSAIPLVYRFRDPDAPGRVKRGLSRFRREIGRLGAAAASTLPGLSSLQGRDDSVADGSYATPVGAELSEARGLPGLGLTYAAERDLRLEPLPVPCALAPLSGEWLAENEAVLQAQERARTASLQRYGLQVTPRTQRGDDLGEEPSAGARPAALPGLEGNVAADPCYATEECSTTREAAGCGEVIECPAEGEDFEYGREQIAIYL